MKTICLFLGLTMLGQRSLRAADTELVGEKINRPLPWKRLSGIVLAYRLEASDESRAGSRRAGIPPPFFSLARTLGQEERFAIVNGKV